MLNLYKKPNPVKLSLHSSVQDCISLQFFHTHYHSFEKSRAIQKKSPGENTKYVLSKGLTKKSKIQKLKIQKF